MNLELNLFSRNLVHTEKSCHRGKYRCWGWGVGRRARLFQTTGQSERNLEAFEKPYNRPCLVWKFSIACVYVQFYVAIHKHTREEVVQYLSPAQAGAAWPRGSRQSPAPQGPLHHLCLQFCLQDFIPWHPGLTGLLLLSSHSRLSDRP